MNDKHEEWNLRKPYSLRALLVLIAIVVLLAISARRAGVDRGITMIGEGLLHAVGIKSESEVAVGWQSFFKAAFPIAISEKTDISRIPNFDRERLPWFSYLIKEPVKEYDLQQLQMVVTGEREYLVKPIGYLLMVIAKMLETIEMAIWGTLLALVLSMPLAFFGARGYSYNTTTYALARGCCSFCRALPELIIAIFFVLLFGFGSLPGIVALGLHCCGFLGKFFADDIENADQGPQDALRCIGANRVQVLWYAVLPQTTPQFVAYVQYILERNVRSATILGIVGAGGIGQELKGRLDLLDYAHVATILLVVFVTVFLLENITQRVRGRLIGA